MFVQLKERERSESYHISSVYGRGGYRTWAGWMDGWGTYTGSLAARYLKIAHHDVILVHFGWPSVLLDLVVCYFAQLP